MLKYSLHTSAERIDRHSSTDHMYMSRTLAAAAICAAAVFGAACAGAMTIAGRGGSAAWRVSVKPSSSAAAPLEYAASEFTNYVARITGVALPVATEAAAVQAQTVRIEYDDGFGESEYRLRAKDGGLLVTGGKRGVLYAIYDLLETYGGVGWFASWRTVVPESGSFEVPDTLNRFEAPSYRLREPAWYDCTYRPDFAARLRTNGLLTEFGSRHGGVSSMHPQSREDGLRHAHTFKGLIPLSEYGASHPEFFSEIDGARVTDRESQLCLTNPELIAEVKARMRRIVERWYPRGQRCFNLSQNDNTRCCRCASCAAVDDEEGSHSGSLVRFVNEIAGSLTNDFPKVVISTFAYQHTLLPPKTRPAPSVMTVFCPVDCDFSSPLEASTHKDNVAFRSAFEGWCALTDNLMIWDYVTDFTYYQMPFPNVATMCANIRYYRRNGVRNMFSQGDTDGGLHADFGELKTWLSAKLLWNPDQDENALIDRFMAGYYGAASNIVRRIFDAQESLPTTGKFHVYLDFADAKWLTDEHLAWADSMWEQAEAAVADDPECLYNVRMGRLPTDCARLWKTVYALDPDRTAGMTWLCRSPAGHIGVPEALKLRDRITNALASVIYGKIDFSESSERANETILARWETALGAELPARGVRSAAFGPVSGLKVSASDGVGAVVSDPDGFDGTVFEIENAHHRWTPTMSLGSVAFDPTTNYTFRIRVKVGKTPEADGFRNTAAFNFCVWHDDRGRISPAVTVKVKDLKDGWGWYETVLSKPVPPGAYFYFQPGSDDTPVPHPAFSKIVFDRLEIVNGAKPGFTVVLR